MRKIIALLACLWALCAGATNITNYPVRTTFNAAYWFLLSDVTAQTNWNLPGNYVASSVDLNNVSNLVNSVSNTVNNINTNFPVTTNFSTITVTNGITNLNLTANTIVKSDANKALASVPNGTGALTNNNAGLFGWFTYASLQDITNTVNSYTNTFMSNTNTIFTNATVLVNQIDYLTNACPSMVGVDFAKGYQACTTNAAFTFNLPINLDSTKTRVQTAVVRVDNSSGPTPIAVTLPANVHSVPGSVLWITNSTYFTFSYYSPDQTNCYAVPIY